MIFPAAFGFSRFLNPVQIPCEFFPLLRFPWITFSLYIHLLHTGRYLAILKVQDHKNLLFQVVKREFEGKNLSQEVYDLHEQQNEVRSPAVLFFYRLSQIFKSSWSTLPMIALFAISYIGVLEIVVALLNLDGDKCMMATKWKMQIISGVDLSFFVFVALLAIGITFLDVYGFFSRRKTQKDPSLSWITISMKSLRSYFLREDPLRFRVQNLATLGVLIFLNIFVKVGLWNLNSICEVEDFELNDVLLNIIVFVSQILLLFSLVWVILFASGCRQCRKQQTLKDDDLVEMLKNNHLREMFKIYCNSEMNIENLMIWTEIQNFGSSKQKLENLTFIYEQFLTSGSTMEVNVSPNVTRQILVALETQDLPENLLDDLKSEIYHNLKDVYSRFINSSEYLDYVKRTTTRDELIRILL